jgi:hypothetical protein
MNRPSGAKLQSTRVRRVERALAERGYSPKATSKSYPHSGLVADYTILYT